MITAATVFGIGMLVLPSIEPPPPEQLAPPPPPPVPVPPPPPPPAPPAVDGPAPEAQAPETEPASAPADATPAPAEPTPAPPSAEPTPSASPAKPTPETAASRDKPADKDVARDAWRKNLPDVSTDPGKATMLIPIKGSIEGATYHVTVKPKSVLITLPKGESMITMPFYSVRHDGFRQLWIKKDDQTGTSLRVVLGDASDPQVEIKEDFVRVTVRRLVDSPAATPAGK
jgi:hypothetical protein